MSGKKWSDGILAVTLINLGSSSQFLAWIILTFRGTEKLLKKVMVTSFKNAVFARRKRKTRIHSVSTVASNLPDLNPVDYIVWGILQEKVYKRCMTDLDDLKHRIIMSGLSWITLSLQLLCISGTVVSQCPSRPVAVILGTIFILTWCLQS